VSARPRHEAGGADVADVGLLGEVLGGAHEPLAGAVHVQLHHQLLGLVGLGGDFAVVEVGREGGEALAGEAVGDILMLSFSPTIPG
jgi:hypothetical protein